MNFIEKIRIEAKKKMKTICLPESYDERILKAAKKLVNLELVEKVVLIGEDKLKKKFSSKKISVINYKNHNKFETYTKKFYEKRKHKGISLEEAEEILKNNLYYASMMLSEGDTDAVVAGAANSTGNVLRAAIKGVGLKKGVKTVSSLFIMVTDKKEFGVDGVLGFGDCAVVPSPDSEQLADIAESSAETFENLVGESPKIALLSFSTNGSAKHERVNKILRTKKILEDRNVGFDFDGELQADAALVSSIAERKAPDSKIAGRANCLIFPSLEAGNIGYKLVQRFADAEAVGPVIQGLAKPYNDLSRGCSVEDIVNTSCLAILNS